MKKFTLAALTVLATAMPAFAQLPDAKTITAKYAAAVNADALLKVKNIKETGTFELPAMGLSAPLTIMRAAPNKNLIRIEIPGMGEVVRGYDGTVGFSMDPMQGNTLMSGKELAIAAEEATTSANLRMAENFTSMETVEKTTMGGKECYKVKLVWKSGRTTFDCFAVDTGLLVGSVQTRETDQGPIEIVTTVSEYKDFNGIKLATKLTQTANGGEQSLTITTVEFDKLDDAAFALPAAIKAMVEKKN